MNKVKYLLVMMVAVFGLTFVNGCSDDDDVVKQDTGVTVDSGSTTDTGVTVDAGETTDTGVTADAGETTDSSVADDASAAADMGSDTL